MKVVRFELSERTKVLLRNVRNWAGDDAVDELVKHALADARARTYASWVCTPRTRRVPRTYNPGSLYWRIREAQKTQLSQPEGGEK